MDDIKEAFARLRTYANQAAFRDFIRDNQKAHLDWMQSHFDKIKVLQGQYDAFTEQYHPSAGNRKTQLTQIRVTDSPALHALCSQLAELESDPKWTLIMRDGPDRLTLSERCLVVAKFFDAMSGNRTLWTDHPFVQSVQADAVMLRLAEDGHSAEDVATHFPAIGQFVESLVEEFEKTLGSLQTTVTAERHVGTKSKPADPTPVEDEKIDVHQVERETVALNRENKEWIRASSELMLTHFMRKTNSLKVSRSKGMKTNDGQFGIDGNGHIWRIDPDDARVVWYLKSSLKISRHANNRES